MGRQWRIGSVLCGLLFLIWPCQGATEAYFTSRDSVEERVAGLIERSNTSIEMALFELKSPPLAIALARAKERGVQIRLILDAEHAKEDLAAGEVRLLGGKNVRGRGVMHHKFALFDRREVVTGSFNWTPGAEHSNYENALLLDDPQTVSAFSREFDTLWVRARPGSAPGGSTNPVATSPRRPWFAHPGRTPLKSIRIRVSRVVRKCRKRTF